MRIVGFALAALVLALLVLVIGRRGDDVPPAPNPTPDAPRGVPPSSVPVASVVPPRPPTTAAPVVAPPPTTIAPIARTGRMRRPRPVPLPLIPRETVRAELARTFATDLPARRLTDDELDRLTDAVFRMRAVRDRLDRTPDTKRHAARIERLRHELTETSNEFTSIAGMSPTDFARIAGPDAGILPEN